ncbi:MAG: UDP-N-acetylmuramate--L-alanine ligase [Owenweeksia sp.]|nr:UDP-N-acetylmuramate--L-alanine ligase [Owenweeksia sp.]
MTHKSHIYLIGIGGIGMSALARYFRSLGKKVAGYDRVRSNNCQQLENEGIPINYEDKPGKILPAFKKPDATLVIYTPAIPTDSEQLTFFQKGGFELMKRAKVLGTISEHHPCLAVAGTHGKTTTSALLAHLFLQAGKPITAFLGGLSVNYQTNFIAGDADSILIAEADEYDRSFLQLQPAGAIITSIDSDHLDIYGTAEDLKNTFKDFSKNVNGPLLVHKNTLMKGLTYALEEDADFSALNIRVADHQFMFDFHSEKESIMDIYSGLPGRHNVENALAAAALALQFGLNAEQVKKGIGSFKGVKRRFEYHIRQPKLVYIDDYAHHPVEVKALIAAVRELYPQRQITGIFQPHLYSRTRDFMDEFAAALSQLDELVLMNIYPARERPIPGINAHVLLEKIDLKKKALLGTQEILTRFEVEKPEVIITIGAGDIDQLINPLKLKLLQ